MSTLDVDDNHVPEQLVDQLAKGYDSLAIELKRVHELSRNLENRLAWAKQQVSLHLFFHLLYFLYTPPCMMRNLSSRPVNTLMNTNTTKSRT